MKCPNKECDEDDWKEITVDKLESDYPVNPYKSKQARYTDNKDRFYFWQLHFLMNPSHKPKEEKTAIQAYIDDLKNPSHKPKE
jgi:hypothetical protein